MGINWKHVVRVTDCPNRQRLDGWRLRSPHGEDGSFAEHLACNIERFHVDFSDEFIRIPNVVYSRMKTATTMHDLIYNCTSLLVVHHRIRYHCQSME